MDPKYPLSGFITKVTCPNFWEGRQGYNVKALVIHKPEGNNNVIIPYLQKSETQKSYNFIVGLDGRVTELVSPDNAAWHSGVVVSPTWKGIIQGANPNLYTIGIALEGFAKDPETQMQLISLYKLIADLVTRYKIDISDETIVWHREIDTGKTCPGFHINKYLTCVSADSCRQALAYALKTGIVANETNTPLTDLPGSIMPPQTEVQENNVASSGNTESTS